MRIENEDLLRIIKEELEGILREAEEAEKVDESLPSRLIGKTHKEKMADRAKKEKFYDRPRVKLSPAKKKDLAQSRVDSKLRTKFVVANSFPGAYMPPLTPEQKEQGVAQGLDTEFPELWAKATS
jgi:hypothetical protein